MDCEYLMEARRHEKPVPLTGQLHPDVAISENFMERHELLFAAVSQHLVAAADSQPGVIDADVREMLAATIRTLKTAGSGLLYTTHSENALASAVQDAFMQRFGEWRALVEKRAVDAGLAGPMVEDGNVMKVLVFLHRLSEQFNNGRPRGRSFLSLVSGWTHGLVIRPKEDGAAKPAEA
jgi:hypothetical protein